MQLQKRSNKLHVEEFKKESFFTILKMTKSIIKNSSQYNSYMDSLPSEQKDKFPKLPLINLINISVENTDPIQALNTEPSSYRDAMNKYFNEKEKSRNKILNLKSGFLDSSSLNLYFNIDLNRYQINKDYIFNQIDLEKIFILSKSNLNQSENYVFQSQIVKILSKDKKQLNIKINSINLKLMNDNNTIESEIFIPFIYLPIFFSFSFEEVHIFLSQCLVFKELNNTKSFFFDAEILLNLVKIKCDENYFKNNFNYNLIKHPFSFKFDWITESSTYTLIVK